MQRITEEWMVEKIDLLMARCPFQPRPHEGFLLDPHLFWSMRDYRGQVLFLLERHKLPYPDVEVYLHKELKSGMRRCGGLFRAPGRWDTSVIPEGWRLVQVNDDYTYTIADYSDLGRPRLREVREPLAILPERPAIGLEQRLLNDRRLLSLAIAHEVAHLHLYHHGVDRLHLDWDLMREYQTDIAIFVMGLGRLILEVGASYRFQYWIEKLFGTMRRIGYLTLEQQVFVHEQVLKRVQSRDPGRPG